MPRHRLFIFSSSDRMRHFVFYSMPSFFNHIVGMCDKITPHLAASFRQLHVQCKQAVTLRGWSIKW